MITQVDIFVDLGNLQKVRDVRNGVQAGAAVCRRVEGVMLDTALKKPLKEMMETCVVPACVCVCGLGTLDR